MKDWNRRTLILMLGILVIVPLVVERYLVGRGLRLSRSELREMERRDWLLGLYECTPSVTCYKVDFDKDGINEFVNVKRRPELREEWLLVTNVEGYRLLMLPSNMLGGEQRTRTAIVDEGAETHLLVYDAANYSHASKSVYRYNGYAMSGTSPTQLEHEILSAMARGQEDVQRRAQIVAASDESFVKLLCYYFVLAVLVAVVFYQRRNGANASNAYISLRGHP